MGVGSPRSRRSPVPWLTAPRATRPSPALRHLDSEFSRSESSRARHHLRSSKSSLSRPHEQWGSAKARHVLAALHLLRFFSETQLLAIVFSGVGKLMKQFERSVFLLWAGSATL
jgi:hypothetical protein